MPWGRLGRFAWALAPIFLYLVCYDLAGRIPIAWRAPIHAELLPYWEQRLCGGLPHQWLSAVTTPWLDLLAAVPYTLHFVALIPYLLWLGWRAGDHVPRFTQTFAVMNLMALAIQLLCPTTPPWYFEQFGTAPAVYGIPGDPGGLARVDTYFGGTYYTQMYAMSRIVFGALPSMHGAWPLVMAYHARPWSRGLAGALLVYTAWMWWAALYLHHHYLVDLLAGALLAGTAIVIVQLLARRALEQRRAVGSVSAGQWDGGARPKAGGKGARPGKRQPLRLAANWPWLRLKQAIRIFRTNNGAASTPFPSFCPAETLPTARPANSEAVGNSRPNR